VRTVLNLNTGNALAATTLLPSDVTINQLRNPAGGTPVGLS
jgi:hypothetical protein